MSLAADIVSGVLLLIGALAVLIGSLGLIRLPDFFTRLHPAGITDTMGAAAILLGLTFQAGFTLVTVKLILVLLLLLVTSPTASHATARAALAHGLKPKLADSPDAPDGDGEASRETSGTGTAP